MSLNCSNPTHAQPLATPAPAQAVRGAAGVWALLRRVRLLPSRAANWKALLGFWRRLGATRIVTTLRRMEEEYGHSRSTATNSSVWKSGEPIPWYTFPAVEYLVQFDYANCDVFEFGGGNSTKFWSARARSVTTVEDESAWFKQLEQSKAANQTLIFAADKEAYAASILDQGREFDVVAVDGTARLSCAENAVKALKSTGIVIVDNSDWLPKTTARLREYGLLQVDFYGLPPIVNFHTCTSIFFRRDAVLRPAAARQPVRGIGAIEHVIDPE